MQEKTIHEGRNVKRLREMLGIKQETLADELGLSQQTVSALEQKEALDKDMLEKIARILKMPVEAIKNFDNETAVYNIQNNYEGSNTSASHVGPNNNCININYEGKWIEAMDKIEKLFERLLQVEKEKNDLLQKLLEGKK